MRRFFWVVFLNLILCYVIIRKRSNTSEPLNALEYSIATLAKEKRPKTRFSVLQQECGLLVLKTTLLPGFEVLQDISGTTRDLEIGTPTALLSLSICWQVKATSQKWPFSNDKNFLSLEFQKRDKELLERDGTFLFTSFVPLNLHQSDDNEFFQNDRLKPSITLKLFSLYVFITVFIFLGFPHALSCK